jgi:hypothetical protein
VWGARRQRIGGGPKGWCARMPIGIHLHLPVVGDGKPVAVPCLVRYGAERGSGSAIFTINKRREAMVRRAFMNVIYIRAPSSHARAVR